MAMAYTPIIPATGVAGYNYLSRTRTEQQALFRAAPEVQRDLDAFSAQIRSVKTPDELLDNYQLMKVALGAFGLDEDIGNRGFMKAVLEADPEDPGSFVNRLADKRYLEFSRAFNFAGSAGPQLDELKSVDAVKAEIEGLGSAEELLGNGALLRAALDVVGLGSDSRNTHFLKLVLESDPADPGSFANRLSDPRYAEFSARFGFGTRQAQEQSVFGFAQMLAGAQDSLVNTKAVLDQPQILAATAEFFGLSDPGTDRGFWQKVLNSDTGDAASYVNRLEDPRYAAISRMFGFGDPARLASAEAQRPEGASGPVSMPVSPLITRFTEAMGSRSEAYTGVSDFFSDFDGLFAVFDLMDLPRAGRSIQYAGRVLESDPSDPNALVNLVSDPRYGALQKALNFQPPDTTRSYPDRFADAIAQRYVDRQFEIQIGEQDPSMRVALGFDRSLDEVIKNGATENSRWFAVMASGPLREVFETVFGLPGGFGTLDVDRQLSVLKERSEARFGATDLADLDSPEMRAEIRNAYLFGSDLSLQGPTAGSSAVLALLAR